MTRLNVFESILGIVRKELKNETVVFTENMAASDIAGWDSLTHMSIMTAIEKQFSVSFSFMDIVNLEKIGDLVDLVVSKIHIE